MTADLPGALVELALRPWGRPLAGLIHDRTPERLVELQPSVPIPGPNCVCLVRCEPERVPALVDECRALAATRGQPLSWNLDPDTRPPDLAARLMACGLVLDEELIPMVLPADAELAPAPEDIEIVDALGDEATFLLAESVQGSAFGAVIGTPEHQRLRFEQGRAEPARHFLLALAGGEPAAAGWATVHPEGVMLNGGGVVPRFQGRGVYRALVAARLDIARQARAPGVATQAMPATSQPVLSHLGFTAVGRWELYVEPPRT